MTQGLHVVHVTDVAQPGEGTAQAQVPVTDTPGYNPRALPDSQGRAQLRTTALLSGHHEIAATDGLWKIGGTEGMVNGAYSAIQVS